MQFTEVDILSASRSMSTSRDSETNVKVEGGSVPLVPLTKHPSSDSQSVSWFQCHHRCHPLS